MSRGERQTGSFAPMAHILRAVTRTIRSALDINTTASGPSAITALTIEMGRSWAFAVVIEPGITQQQAA